METPQEFQKNADSKEKQTYHLVSMPKIILTRLDEKTIASSMTSEKKVKSTLKKSALGKTARPSSSPTVKRIVGDEVEKRKRGRPKKFDDMILPTTPVKKLKPGKELAKTPKVTSSIPKKSKQQEVGGVKSMLNKTMLQKRSKITIPAAKKAKTALTPQNKGVAGLPKKVTPSPKLALTPQNKVVPVLPKKVTPSPKQSQIKSVTGPQKKVTPLLKQTGPQKKVTPLLKQTKRVVIPQTSQPVKDSDSSEDEFLYDELIEELQSSPKSIIKSVGEKTTNITIKSNDGNKPPRIVKGGIVRKVNLPPDLKIIASPNTSQGLESEKAATPSHNRIIVTSRKSKGSKPELENHVPAKKASPWPVTMSPPSKTSLDAPNIQKKTVTKDPIPVSTASKENNFSKIQQKLAESANITIDPKPDTPKPIVKRKMGPKQAISESSNSQYSNQDDSLSDEYTEEETLENEGPVVVGNSTVQSSHSTSIKPLTVQPVSAIDSEKDDDDPNLDLLRILTDDTEEPFTAPSHEPVEVAVRPNEFTESDQSDSFQPHESDEINSKHVKPPEMPTEDKKTEDPTTNTEETSINDSAPTVVVNEDPPVRTIYDLMNEVALQNPSWNLHIIPETNAFCIAQVTKGRLGLPTLKKCIELDPEDYSAKVYIHQYHIKRFDGVYDSEASISALIDEIDSIRA